MISLVNNKNALLIYSNGELRYWHHKILVQRHNSNYILTNQLNRGRGIFNNSGAIIGNGFRGFLNSGSRFISCLHLLWNRRSHPIIRGSRASRLGKFPAGARRWEQCYRMQMSLISHLLSGRRLPASLVDLSSSPIGTQRRFSLSLSLCFISVCVFYPSLSFIPSCTVVACLTVASLSICPICAFLYQPAPVRDSLSPVVSNVRIDHGLSAGFDRLDRTE